MRAGEIITCPWCGGEHELTLARMTESICYENGVKTVTKLNRVLPGLLFYNCGRHTYLANVFGKNTFDGANWPWYKRLWHRITRNFW